MSQNLAERLVWIDCEMTGLDTVNDVLVEVACVVTDAELNEVAEPFSVVIATSQEKLEGMDPFVTSMHTESGLLPEIPNGITLEAAEQQLFEYITSLVPEARKAPLAGSSIHVDRIFLARDMPRVDSYLHYRIVDVSSFKELVRRWYPKVYFAAPAKTGNHRALGDVRDSILELKYYRAAVMLPSPGPDTATARSVSATISSTDQQPVE